MDNHLPYLSAAAKYAQRAIEINDHLSAPHATLGGINLALGKSDLALQEFQKALELAPRDADAVLGLAFAYEYMNRFDESEAAFKRAIALRPDYWDGYTALAIFYYHQNRLQEALAQYKRVIELTPDNAEGYSNLGMAYIAVGNDASNALAEGALRKAIELGPNYAAHTNLSVLYLNEHRYPEAVQEARKALEYNDKDWEAWDNLLLAYSWIKDKDNMDAIRAKTLSLLEQSIAASPKQATVQSRLSTFYAEDNQREKAVNLANTAVALNPKDSIVLTDLAETYEALGDRKKAIRFAQESLQNGGLLDLQRRPSLRNLLADASFRSNGKQ
jgi:Flp pilus assembly protein TadD